MAGIPTDRVIEKLDAYLNLHNDYAAAERHLKYWLAEAEELKDERGAFTVLNEMIGMYRKGGRKQEAFDACGKVLALTERLGIADTVGGATAFLNTATARKAFGDPEGAAELYARARTIYERELDPGDARLGGLYNNMALALADLGRYDEAMELFRSALKVMERIPGGEADCAVTYQNMAETLERSRGYEAAEDEILSCMDSCLEMLNSPELARNGYYAFAAEKCIPLLEHYEYYLAANELRRRISEIRGRD